MDVARRCARCPLRRADRRPAGRLLAAATEVAHRARRRAVPRGRARGLLVGAASRAPSTWSVTSVARTPCVGRMDVPGRWAGGFRAWDEHGVYLATGRGASRAGCCGCRPRCCESGRRLVPVRRAPDRGPVPHRAHHRVDGAAARVAGHPRHAGRRAGPRDQQPGRRRHPRRRRPRGRRTRRCCRPWAGSPTVTSRPSSSPRSTRCAASSRPGTAGSTRWPWPTARRNSPRGSPATASNGTG